MIGLPAIALAMLSVDLATSGRSRMYLYGAAAGVAFALALLTKLFVLLILPAVLAALWRTALGPGWTDWRRAAGATLCFGIAAAATAVAMFLAVQGFSLSQLFGTHIAARSLGELETLGGFEQLFRGLTTHAPLALFFAVVYGLAAFRKRPTSILLVPVLWLAVALLALGAHRPLWRHQLLILVPPLCWLGAVGFKSLFVRGERLRLVDWVTDHADRRLRLAGWALFLALIPVGAILAGESLRRTHRESYAVPKIDEQMARTALALFDSTSDVLITDKPIDAFHLGKTVPPDLAVWSVKRVVTGRITDEDVLREIEARPDSQIMLRRHAASTAFLDRIAQRTPRVAIATARYSNMPIAFFTRGATAASSPERELLDSMQAVTGKSLGGLTDMHGRRLARAMSGSPLPERAVVARPPGSAQELGACLVAASRVLQSRPLLLEALGVGSALACVQSPDGGWQEAAVPAGQCASGLNAVKPNETLDDGTVPSILYFLFDLSDRLSELSVEQPGWLNETIARALDFSIRLQQDQGGWPQTASDRAYHGLATLNDDTTTGMVRVLLAAYRRNGNPAYLDAARRGGDFLLRAQGSGGQAAFAQQYDRSLKIAPARKFEPAAYASLETGYAINALIDLNLATGDERYLTAARSAAAWLRKSEIEPDEWARFYEVGTNRPIYADRSGAATYDLADLPPSESRTYRWAGGRDVFPEIGLALDRLERLREGADRLKAFDASVAAASLLSATPTARLPLVPDEAAIAPETLQSTRTFAEHCAGLVAAQTANSGKPSDAIDGPQD